MALSEKIQSKINEQLDRLEFLEKPKIPCIALKTNITDKKINPILSKLDGIPFIDKYSKYPELDGTPMICFLQLNMDQIFSYLNKADTRTTRYFDNYPKTGILQFYRNYCEKLVSDDIIRIVYLKTYNRRNHDIQKEKELKPLYIQFRKKHGNIHSKSNAFKFIEIIDAEYDYDFVNSTMTSHPEWSEKIDNTDPKHFIKIGGFPYHLQDDFEFDQKTENMLLTITTDLLGLNLAINKDNMKNLIFTDLKIDIAY